MELFNETFAGLDHYLAEAKARNALRSFSCNNISAWPEQTSLVLQEDTAIELGGAEGSLFMVLWTGRSGLINPGKVTLVGPDLSEAPAAKLPITQIIMVKGAYRDEYETYQALQDVIFDTRLKGISMRYWPDRQKVWCRVGRKALGEGFNLIRYGCTLVNKLRVLPAVEEAEIIFATEDLHQKNLLIPVAEKVHKIMETLLKIYDQLNFDCESCDYKEVCAEVAGLKEIHRRLHEERE